MVYVSLIQVPWYRRIGGETSPGGSKIEESCYEVPEAYFMEVRPNVPHFVEMYAAAW
jgi:hypothetical protein